MEPRGDKYFAVMALKDGWKKPRFVWGAHGRQLYIYDRHSDAIRRAKEMKADKLMQFCSKNEYSKNAPKTIEVQWIVCPVWIETIPN